MTDLLIIVGVISASCVAAIFVGIALVKQMEKENHKKHTGRQFQN